MIAAYGESYLIDALVVKPAGTDDGRDPEFDASIQFHTTSSEMVAKNEVAIRDALIGVLEAGIMKAFADGSGRALVPELLEAIEEIVGRDIVRNVTIESVVPRPRRSR